MGDFNVRRTARIRRILENSESRLMKITGKNSVTGIGESSRPGLGASNSDYINEQLNALINGIIPGNEFEDINERIISGNDTIPTKVMDSFADIPPKLYTHKQPELNNTIDDACSMASVGHNDDQHQNYDKECLDQQHVASGSQVSRYRKRYTKIVPSILQNQANYVILAMIINVLLFLKLDHLFGKAITVPCFTMILARLYISDNTQESQKGSLLVAALMLCNVKPKVAYTVRRVTATIGTILHDFALYIFSFVLVYCGISYCTTPSNIPDITY